MSSTRSVIAPPPFAGNASTVIPPTPVAGVSYRDPVAGPASSPDGWPYAERVNSAEFNQIMFQMSTIVELVDKKGVVGWSDQTDYTQASVQFGSNGILYTWLQASGPNNGGAKDPVSNPTYWGFALYGRLLRTTLFSSSGTFTPIPGMSFVVYEIVGGGGSGGGATVPSVGNVSLGAPGGSASYATGSLANTQIGASQAITIGAAGSVTLGASGGNGGASSIGALISVPGGTGGSALNNNVPPTVNGNGVNSGAAAGAPYYTSIGNASGISVAVSAAAGYGGQGGASQFGNGGQGGIVNGLGATAPNFGAGGGGCMVGSGGVAIAGAPGRSGLVIIREYSR